MKTNISPTTPPFASIKSWGKQRLGSLIDFRNEKVGDSWANTKLLSLTLQGVIPRDLENRMGKMPASFSTYQHVYPGDIVFCLFDVEETPRTVGLVNEEGMVTGAYTVARPRKDVDSNFLTYHYLHFDQFKSLRHLYAGLRNTIRTQDFKNIAINFPPLEEQRRIAEFLDRETAEIDAFIADQEELQRLSFERLTSELDLQTQRPSEHVSLRHVSSIKLGKMLNSKAQGPHAHEVPYLRAANIQEWGELTHFNDAKYMAATADELRTLTLQKGDIVLVEGGSGYAKPALLEQSLEGWIFQNHVFRIRVNRDVYDERFLLFRLLSLKLQGFFESQVTQATIPTLASNTLGSLKVPVIPLETQKSISLGLQEQLDNVRTLSHDIEEAIELSKERRSALISAAVTGQIDVSDRYAAEKVYEEVETST